MRIITLENSLKYASWISINTINCYCGKYQDSKYKGIICDTCSVQVAKGGLKKVHLIIYLINFQEKRFMIGIIIC